MDLSQIEKLVDDRQRKKQLATLQQQQQQPIAQDGKPLHADLSPEAGASFAMSFIRSHGKGDANPAERVGKILQQVQQVKTVDLGNVEAMLYSHALTLQSMFNELASMGNVLIAGSKTDEAIALLHVALKSQNQCRQTLLALNEVKNLKRPTQFVKTYIDINSSTRSSPTHHN